MAGCHHGLDGHESEWTPGVGDRQGGLACCDSWGRKESDTTERLNWTELKLTCLSSRTHLIITGLCCILGLYHSLKSCALPPSFLFQNHQSRIVQNVNTSFITESKWWHSGIHFLRSWVEPLLRKCSATRKPTEQGNLEKQEKLRIKDRTNTRI